MLYVFGKTYRRSSYIGMLLLIVFALCWGQNLGLLQGCGKIHAQSSLQDHNSAAKLDKTQQQNCDKSSHLLKQFQADSGTAILSTLLLLLLPIITTTKNQQRWLAPSWRPRRRPHLICCCFLE